MKRALLFLLAGLVLLLAMSGVAAAAGTSPQDILNDWIANHPTLTGDYTIEQLNAFLNSPIAEAYLPSGDVIPLRDYVTSLLAKPGRSTFPWTGAQIAAILAAAALLIGLGVLLRRSAKRKQPGEE